MSASGPSRHTAVPREFGRFRREADIKWYRLAQSRMTRMYGPAVRCKKISLS